MANAPRISRYSVMGWLFALGLGTTIGMVFRLVPTAPKSVAPVPTAEAERHPAIPSPQPLAVLADEDIPSLAESTAPAPEPQIQPFLPYFLSPEMLAKLPKIEDIRPLPAPELPEVPPHEGAFIDLPYTVDCPDLILIEVLETLPGRPILGERLLRPDGTITLGFYGDLYVRGLTREQIKVKVVLHLRKFLTDSSLGLIGVDSSGPSPGPAFVMPELPDETQDLFDTSEGKGPAPPNTPVRPGSASLRGKPTKRAAKQGTPKPAPSRLPSVGFALNLIPPAESACVFAEVAKYNSKVYYVLGAFNSTGKFPVVGNETVLDAIQHGGGLAPNADRATLRLVRPAWGKRPAQTYPINLDVIENHADKRANLQMLPGDRLLVDRNPDRMFRGNVLLPPLTFPWEKPEADARLNRAPFRPRLVSDRRGEADSR